MFRDWNDKHLKLAIKAARVALWSWNVDNNRFTMDDAGFAMWFMEPADVVEFEELSKRIHPADRDRVRAAFTATRSIEGSYEIDFRIVPEEDAAVRWISARGQGADEGIENRSMFGVFIDVTGRKQAEESSELLAGEMSHRVKNLLSIANGLTHFTAKSSTTVAEMAKALTERLTALDRAHDLVRPLPDQQGKAALLGDLFSVLLSPYDNDGFAGRIRVAVPRMGVGHKSATTIAMVVHELATNAVKHGCLSCDTGALDISCRSNDDNDLYIVWTETGGPEITGTPEKRGFGSKLIERSHLKGDISYEWAKHGLIVTIRIRKQGLDS